MSLTTLPLDLLEAIACYLPLKQLLNLSETCQSHHSYLTSDCFLSRYVPCCFPGFDLKTMLYEKKKIEVTIICAQEEVECDLDDLEPDSVPVSWIELYQTMTYLRQKAEQNLKQFVPFQLVNGMSTYQFFDTVRPSQVIRYESFCEDDEYIEYHLRCPIQTVVTCRVEPAETTVTVTTVYQLTTYSRVHTARTELFLSNFRSEESMTEAINRIILAPLQRGYGLCVDDETIDEEDDRHNRGMIIPKKLVVDSPLFILEDKERESDILPLEGDVESNENEDDYEDD